MRTSTRTFLIAAALSGFMAAPVFAATPAASHTKTAQQERMTMCTKEAKGKKGAEHKAFMKSCLKGEKTGHSGKKLTASQERMRTCSKESKGKKGAEHKAFMKSCLKAK
ncbi:MAG TPA: PsiF family protein [Burkholderiaceae bacterium]|nr:PsiF family protein [Burkholderiaceae bacterium]